MKKIVACFLALVLALGCIPALAEDVLPREQGWFENNHAVAFGPKLTGDWKTYAVVDLSYDGVRTLKLVAAGMWEIGCVDVTVEGDSVTVTYRMHEEAPYTSPVRVEGEYLNFYADVPGIADISAESSFRFGQPISIAQDLGGEEILAMYAELIVDYAAFGSESYRFWENARQNRTIVEEMRYNWALRGK